MKIPSLLAATLAASCLTASLPAAASVLLHDDFESDSATTQLNFNSLTKWSVEGGTIDYVRNGDFGISCMGNIGGCLDMDGSRTVAGRIVSKAVFTLTAADSYTIAMQLSGNQRGGAADGLRLGMLDDSTGVEVFFSEFALGTFLWNRPFGEVSASFSGLAVDYSHGFRIFIAGLGGDNIGAVLDDVSFSNRQGGTVPLPASGALAVVALAGLAVVRRRARAGGR